MVAFRGQSLERGVREGRRMVFWVISVPLVESQAQTRNLLETKLKWQKLADVSNVNLPTLKIGTLDSLLSLSDDLVKINGA